MYRCTVILRSSSLQALETGIYSQELLLKIITLIFWNMWGRHLNTFKSSAWAGCKIIGNISPRELLWSSVHFAIMPPSEFHSSGQFKASTFVRKEHYMSFGILHSFHKSWGRPESCRTALLAILCWEALRGMRQQLSLNVWILANTRLCVWEQLYCWFVWLLPVQH